MTLSSTLDVQTPDDRRLNTTWSPHQSGDAGTPAWLSIETIPFPRSTIWFDEAYGACRRWCEQRDLAAPTAQSFRTSVLAHGCEIDRQRCPDHRGKQYDYVIFHLRIGRGSFSESTLEAFESQRRRRAAQFKAAS